MSASITSSGLTGGLKALAVDIPIDPVVGRQALFDAETYDTAPVGQADVQIIGASATIDQATLRSTLAAAENQDVGDTASITWFLARDADSATALAAALAGTHTAAASTVVSGTGQYLAISRKIVSSGTSVGSI